MRIEPIEPARHATALFEAFAEDREGRIWTYLPYGPFPSASAYRDWMNANCSGSDPLWHAILALPSKRPVGVATYLRINRPHGVVEIGHLCFAPALQRTPAATEAVFLMLERAFDELGNRRCEWKCDSLNARSRRAARRLGFTFEGLFRNATTYKGRNRDTAWYAILDREWPALRAAYGKWLDPSNFDPDGNQRSPLETRGAHDPA